MSYRFAASTTGPLAKIAGSLALPAALQLNSQESHQLWAFVDKEHPAGFQNAWAILPVAASVRKDRFAPQFLAVEDWLPGMTALLERRVTFQANAAAEVSGLWTSLAAPLPTAIAGDIGLDLDLGIRAQAQWQAQSDCWWSIQRPGAAPVLRVRLSAARRSARSISVKAMATAGLDQATQNAIGAALGRHRTQILHRLRQGVSDALGKLPAPKQQVMAFLEKWLALPANEQAEQWRQPADSILAGLKSLIEGAADNTLAQTDQLIARLEFAAVRAMEKKVEASLSAAFDKAQSNEAILDAGFDFSANAGLHAIFHRVLDGDLQPLLEAGTAGITLRACRLQEDLSRRQTFSWRLPFTSGFVSSEQRLRTAMEALDDETGRIVRGHAVAENVRRTRNASSLLAIEGAFAGYLGGDVTVHDAASLSARFAMTIRTNRAAALQPLLDLYGAGTAEQYATGCRLEVVLAPESIAHWLEPQDPAEVSRRMQKAWRALLPAAVDMHALDRQSAAPLLVWAALPITTGALRTERGLELNRGGDLYWDWADPQLLEAMIWNARTQAALEARLAEAHFSETADNMRRAVARPVGAAVLKSLLQTEARFIDRVTRLMNYAGGGPRNPVETMKNLSAMLAGMTEVFHGQLESIYGSGAARALGPLLLSSASPRKPAVTVEWLR